MSFVRIAYLVYELLCCLIFIRLLCQYKFTHSFTYGFKTFQLNAEISKSLYELESWQLGK